MPMVEAFLNGFTNEQLKALSDDIIVNQARKYHNLPCDHIDIINIPIGQSSLKIYAGRLHCKKMQDLPIEPSATIKESDISNLRQYCENDVDNTRLIFDKVRKQIELREDMTEQYGINLNSKSDAQIAEAIIKSEMQKTYNIPINKFKAKNYADNHIFKYTDPKIIKFKSHELNLIFNRLLKEEFKLAENGSIICPDWLGERITIGTTVYQMGIGGIHSCEKAQHIKSDNDYHLCEQDVTGFYPNIIMQQGLYPESIGVNFLELYKSIVTRRTLAKKRSLEIEKELKKREIEQRINELEKELAECEVTAATLKVATNGSFGKFGSKYSFLYSPNLLLQTTITGQLSLLMLIENLEENNIKVVSANTDGIVMRYHKEKLKLLNDLIQDWEKTTGYNLERTDYREIASRDVNNYIAVKLDGKTKCKGCFGEASLSKNPNNLIIYESVAQYVAKGISIVNTITTCRDIRKFITIRNVTGGSLFNGKYLGKAVRFYHSDDISLLNSSLIYAKNGNKVPMSQGCRPLMELPDTLPDDINYDYYIAEAIKLCKLTGIDYA
jgi:hypothetical protein